MVPALTDRELVARSLGLLSENEAARIEIVDASGPQCTSDETVVGSDASKKVAPVRTRAGDDGSVVFDVPSPDVVNRGP